MEILVFGLIAMRNGYRQAQETFVREPDELPPLDVRALAHLYNVPKDSSKLSSDPISSLGLVERSRSSHQPSRRVDAGFLG